MAMTPHKIYGANTNTGGGFTPDTMPLNAHFVGYTVRGPATITRVVFDIQFLQGSSSTVQVIAPADFQNTYAYILCLTQVASGNIQVPPVLSPLLSPSNDILHYGVLNKDTSGGVPGMKMSEKPVIVETQRKIASGQDASLWVAWNSSNAPPVVQLVGNMVFFVVYLT